MGRIRCQEEIAKPHSSGPKMSSLHGLCHPKQVQLIETAKVTTLPSRPSSFRWHWTHYQLWGSRLCNLGWIKTSGLNRFSLFLGAFPVLPHLTGEGCKNAEIVMYWQVKWGCFFHKSFALAACPEMLDYGLKFSKELHESQKVFKTKALKGPCLLQNLRVCVQIPKQGQWLLLQRSDVGWLTPCRSNSVSMGCEQIIN